MSPTLELEQAVETRHATPKLLVEWSSQWEEFVGSIKPALRRSEARLAGEAPFGLIPLRIMIPSYVLEAFLVLSAIFIKVKIDELRPYVAPAISSHDVIYYSGDELPRTQDVGGAEAGRAGEAGGGEAHHRTQTIKVWQTCWRSDLIPVRHRLKDCARPARRRISPRLRSRPLPMSFVITPGTESGLIR
jgi:hypothetical protein